MTRRWARTSWALRWGGLLTVSAIAGLLTLSTCRALRYNGRGFAAEASYGGLALWCSSAPGPGPLRAGMSLGWRLVRFKPPALVPSASTAWRSLVAWPPRAASSGTVWFIDLPLWMPLVGVGIPTCWLWRLSRRSAPGSCPTCGYDLAGITTGLCPECGKATP